MFEDHWKRRSPNAVLFGIVEHYGQIAQSKQGSRGTYTTFVFDEWIVIDCLLYIDYYQNIKLIDPSASGTDECITTLLFHKSHTALYKELRYGDVFIVRDARVQRCDIKDENT